MWQAWDKIAIQIASCSLPSMNSSEQSSNWRESKSDESMCKLRQSCSAKWHGLKDKDASSGVWAGRWRWCPMALRPIRDNAEEAEVFESGRLAKLNQGRLWWRTEIAWNIFIMKKCVHCPLYLIDWHCKQFFPLQVNAMMPSIMKHLRACSKILEEATTWLWCSES